MKIQAFSDTHGRHNEMAIDTSVDTLVFAGDCANYRNITVNEKEVLSFIEWFKNIDVKNKIMIGGNHDFVLKNSWMKKLIKKEGIIYLEDRFVEVDGVRFFGSPRCPYFNDWCFNQERSSLSKFWHKTLIGEEVDVLITHTPPKGILDRATRGNSIFEATGCSGLFKVTQKIKPKHHFFGHIHDSTAHHCYNFGSFELNGVNYHNVSAVEEGKFNELIRNNKGIIVEI